MKDNKTRKELIGQYMERDIIGGVYVIRNSLNNKLLLCATADLKGSKNRFEFSKKFGSCVDLKLQSDWDEQKGEQFCFEVMEELKKGQTQTSKEFMDDINILKEIWIEKLADSDFY